MTQTPPPLSPLPVQFHRPEPVNAAGDMADSNYAANRAALDSTQPGLMTALADTLTNIEWIFARDGSLTALSQGEKWWGGCSLPRRAAEFMFKKLEVRGVLGCFLSPVHAAQIRVALDLLEPQQAIVALVPESDSLGVILHCEDFAADLKAHRLWFAAGGDWQNILTDLFVKNPGLPTPADFIRAIAPDNTLADQMIAPAQTIFAAETTRRGEELARINSTKLVPAMTRSSEQLLKLCVLAPSHFRLWNDAPATLAKTVAKTAWFCPRFFDSDDPASASPIELARHVAGADAVLTANLTRADLPAVIPVDKPIIAWITIPRIPSPQADSPKDSLLLADSTWQARALDMGWAEDRIRVAGWPEELGRTTAGAAGSASLIADTHALTPPSAISEYSSHLLLWELVEAELRRDPFLLKPDVDRYLNSRLARFQIDEANHNRSLFIERLIVPAYQQGLVNALIEQGFRLKLYGKGWEQTKQFAPYLEGPVGSRTHFEHIVDASQALVHAWPISHAHPIDAAGRPVIRPTSRGVPASIEPARGLPRLSAEIIRGLLA